MLHLLLVWLLSAVALLLTAYLLPTVQIASFGTAMIAALLIGFLNATLGWLMDLIVFPVTWLLPGLVALFINAIIIYLVSRLLRGFHVENFISALLAALILSILNVLLRSVA